METSRYNDADMMDIEFIKHKTELLKKATLQKAVLIKDLAKEIKVSVTDLMQYILDNPNLFATEEVWSYKSKPQYYYICGKKCKDTIQVKDKLKGLGVSEVYVSAEDNWRTDEWLAKKIKENAKTIRISKWDNYGTIEGYYVAMDAEDNRYRKHLWRNTPEKIDELKRLGVFHETTFFIGGFGDCSSHPCSTAISDRGRKIAEENGWTIAE